MFLDGSGNFDIRDVNDEWIRIHCGPGDLLVLPEGIYHRLILDDKKYAKVMRFFKGEPVWTPYNRGRSTDESSKRIDYLKNLAHLNRLNAFVLDNQRPVTKDYLASLGVLYWKVDIDDSGKLNTIREARKRPFTEHVLKNDDRLKLLSNEHLTTDEEIWFITSGSGYFDVRGHKDEWIRINAEPTDLFVIPPGVYNRFTPDSNNLAIRLFTTSVPEPRNQSTDQSPIRSQYLQWRKPTSYGRTNKVISDKTDFDAIIQSLDFQTNHNENPIVIYLTAADDETTGQPWCPDARKAGPILEQALGEIEKNINFVKIPIIRSEYKDNPNYFYRTHPIIQLKKVPTLVLWKNGSVKDQLIETEIHDLERVRSFLKIFQAAL